MSGQVKLEGPKVIERHKPAEGPTGRSRLLGWISIAIILALAAAIRIHLLQIPLERDEGEYAYAGQLMLHGIPPYKLAYNMKMPGIYAAYALIMALFGQTIAGIHLGFLLINLATIVLVFLLAKRLFGTYAGVVAAASYALLSVSQSVLGTAAHATHFVVLPALGGMLLMLMAIDSGRLWTFFWSGLSLGLAFIMKQPGALFIAFAALYVLWRGVQDRPVSWSRSGTRVGALLVGAAIPLAATCAILGAAGVFGRFWFWTVAYAKEYATSVPIADGVKLFKSAAPRAIGPSVFLWILAGIGLPMMYLDSKTRTSSTLVLGLAVFSFLAVCPGLWFRRHYFVLMLPAVAILTGVAVASGRQFLLRARLPACVRVAPLLVFLMGLGYCTYAQKDFLLLSPPDKASRMTYGANPFPESVEIARCISDHTVKGDRIAVIGSEPQIYFYSRRLSATGYIYTYGLMEKQKYALRMQREMIEEIERAHPEYLVFVNIPDSWLMRPGSDKMILDWFKEYSRRNYDVVGLVEIVSMEWTNYFWDEAAVGRSPESNYYVYVLRRKAA